MKEYKKGLRRRVSRERVKNKRYQDDIGKAGCDSDDLRLNRTFFLNDEKALEWLGFAQQSSYRRQGLRSIPMLTHSINRGEHPV